MSGGAVFNVINYLVYDLEWEKAKSKQKKTKRKVFGLVNIKACIFLKNR